MRECHSPDPEWDGDLGHQVMGEGKWEGERGGRDRGKWERKGRERREG